MTTVEPLVAEHHVAYTYTRSAGPVIGAFIKALADRKILGIKGKDGRVIVPPVDYDPITSDDLDELVEVASTGVVTTWAWNDSPSEGQPLERPFAWALVKLDGADTSMLAAVDCGAVTDITTGLKVTARWAEQPTGTIKDLVCFEASA